MKRICLGGGRGCLNVSLSRRAECARCPTIKPPLPLSPLLFLVWLSQLIPNNRPYGFDSLPISIFPRLPLTAGAVKSFTRWKRVV